MISTVLSYGIYRDGIIAELPVKSNKLIRYCRSVVLQGGYKSIQENSLHNEYPEQFQYRKFITEYYISVHGHMSKISQGNKEVWLEARNAQYRISTKPHRDLCRFEDQRVKNQGRDPHGYITI